MKKIFIGLYCICVCLQSIAQPSGYYDNTMDIAGQALKLKLHQIISEGHTVRTYGEFRDVILPDLDEDPNNSDNIMLFYKNVSIPKANFASGGQADFWNREHTWPSSHGFGDDSDTAYTDVHNLRPSDATVNSSKSNKDFNEVEHIAANEEGEAPGTYTTSAFWEPRDEIKGDIARILMYMDVRYESRRLNLELVDRASLSNQAELGVLSTLLRWHQQDPVDAAESARHEKAYGYQHNRNPFVDHPEFAEKIWGDISQPFISVDPSGFNTDFGAVVLGDSLVQQYTVKAYNLTSDLIVDVAPPFAVSQDGKAFSQQLSWVYDGQTVPNSYDIYVKYAPTIKGETSTWDIVHSSTDLDTLRLSVSGVEGELSTLSIAEARGKSPGTVVSVVGVVLDYGNNSSRSRVIYDGTAGIVVRSPDNADNETGALNYGDSVLVTGGLTVYNQLLQINRAPMSVTLLASGATVPAPKLVTLSQIDESLESQLVRVNEVRFSGSGQTFAGGGSNGNFNISDSTGTLVVRIGAGDHPLVGTIIPAGKQDVIGFVGQFGSDYQLSPRLVSDLSATPVPDGAMLSIAEARTAAEGQVVKVKGLVIAGENNSEHNRIIYDGTGGLVLRSLAADNASATLKAGDSVIVSGGVLDYNGLFEIEKTPISMEVTSSGHPIPEPKTIALSEVGEAYESQLVKLSGVQFEATGSFVAGNYTLTKDGQTLQVRISYAENPLIGTPIPSGSVDVIGYVGQSFDTYQLFIRSAEDISKGVLSVSARPAVMLYPNPASSQLYLQFNGQPLNAAVSIFTLDGKQVLKSPLLNGQLNVSSLKKGVYLLNFQSGQEVYSHTFIKH